MSHKGNDIYNEAMFEQEKPDVMDEIQLRFAVAHFLATHSEQKMFDIVLEEVESARKDE